MPGTRRGWRWRANPLRRRSDVVEAWLVLGMGATVLLGAPAVGVVVGGAALADARVEAQRQRAERLPARAELTRDAPSQTAWTATGGSPPSTYPVSVRWTTEAGERRTGTARVTVGLRTGDRVDIWLDRRGDLVGAPWDDSDLWLRALSTGAGAAAVGAGAALVTGWAVRLGLDHRRLAAWEREWATTAPDGPRPPAP
ncbi:hypothetical protein [Streptomyces sp. NPDC059009]|uniref:Rv1733c family protein n=1 Tax=Streptomyces sp. NPDC059009 TaxID=3346694 RepID=UPI00369AF4E8